MEKSFLLIVVLFAFHLKSMQVLALEQVDPLKRMDDYLIGAVIASQCDPSFNWKSRIEGSSTTGQKAYEKILADLQAKNPNDPRNENLADRTFKLRTEEMFRKGEQIVSEYGCTSPEVQHRLRIFQSTN